MPYSDGTVNYGDISVTLSTLGAVIIEGFTVTRPSQAIEQFNSTGTPLKQKLVEKFATASGTVVIPSSGSKPAQFETFTYNAETWILSEVGESHGMNDYDKAQCSMRKKYN